MWLKRVHLFLDNACSTNKNAFLMSWAMELVQQGVVDFIQVSFVVTGYTKFEPDRLFCMTAKAYASSDVFSTEELATTMSPYARPIVDDGKLVSLWREKLTSKYTKLSGICDLHNFVIVRHLVTGNAVTKV